MKSKTKISKQLKRKTNANFIKDILESKKNPSWLNVANILSYPRRKRMEINLDKINDASKEGETILVPGKVLSQGNIEKNKDYCNGFFKGSYGKTLELKN